LALLFPIRSARESSLYISAVCVRAACQRRGLGGRIMRTASAVAADEGLPTLAGSVQAAEQQR
jgi:ribosomal protein S18 acetylase RimI-like enzyme